LIAGVDPAGSSGCVGALHLREDRSGRRGTATGHFIVGTRREVFAEDLDADRGLAPTSAKAGQDVRERDVSIARDPPAIPASGIGAVFYDLYADPREQNPMRVPLIHPKGSSAGCVRGMSS
jgi:hypothetical protein